MKVLNYGSLNIDLVFSVPHIVRPGETIPSYSMTRSAGGKGANQSAALGKAGVRVYHAGKIGQDGQWLVSNLQQYGVDTRFIITSSGNTGQAFIQLDENRQNAIVLYPGGNMEITVDEIKETLSFFGPGDLLLLQNEIVHVGDLIFLAHEIGMHICLNPAPFSESVFNLPLDMVTTIIVNEIEGAELALQPQETWPENILDALVEKYPKAEIILTAGPAGAFYGFGDKRVKGSIIDVPVVDTTGAGDTFTGYFWAARIKGCSVEECLGIACRAASIAVSRPGATDAVPFADEVFD